MQYHVYESRFQKFYTIRFIQICEQKTLKIGFKQILVYSNKQSKINKQRNKKSIKQIYQGEIYISTRKYMQILPQFPKQTYNINLSDHLKKKIGSNSLIQTNIKETVSLIIEKQQLEQEIINKQALQHLKNHRSIRNRSQIMKSTSSITVQKQIINIQVLIIIVMTALLVIVFLLLKKLR